MGWLSPEAWNGVGVVTLLVIFAIGHAVAFTRGWLVLGVHHREVVAGKDSTIERLEAGDAGKDRTIEKLSNAVSEFGVSGQIQAHLLESIKELAEGRS